MDGYNPDTDSIVLLLLREGANAHPVYTELLITPTGEAFDRVNARFIKRWYRVNSYGINYPFISYRFKDNAGHNTLIKLGVLELLYESTTGKSLLPGERIRYRRTDLPPEELVCFNNLTKINDGFKIPKNATRIKINRLQDYCFTPITRYGMHDLSNVYLVNDAKDPLLFIRNKDDYYLIRRLLDKEAIYWIVKDINGKRIQLRYKTLLKELATHTDTNTPANTEEETTPDINYSDE